MEANQHQKFHLMSGNCTTGLVSTACACASIPWEIMIHFCSIEKQQVRKRFLMHVWCLETCHAVPNLLPKRPEFTLDCPDFAYTRTAGKLSPLSTDMRTHTLEKTNLDAVLRH